jgi:methionyl-tRNA formyltransferase
MAIVSSYGLIIPKNLLDIPRYGFVNIHASLLPRWRGASPIQSAILAGDAETGITVMKMDTGVDTGDIISTKAVKVSSDTSYGELSEKLGDLGAEMVIEFFDDIEGNLSKSRKQPEEGVTYTKKITKDDCRIDWNDSAENILRRILAFSPAPAAWTEIDGLRIKILNAEAVDLPDSPDCYRPGFVYNDMIVTCLSGSLKLTEIQPSGKKSMSGADFLRGHRNLVGKVLSGS